MRSQEVRARALELVDHDDEFGLHEGAGYLLENLKQEGDTAVRFGETKDMC